MSLFNPNLKDEEDSVLDSIQLATQDCDRESSAEFWILSAVERTQMRRRNFPGWQNIPPPTPFITTVPLPNLPNETVPRWVNPVLLYQAGDHRKPPSRRVRGMDLRQLSFSSVISSQIGGAPLHLERTSVVKPEVREVSVYHPDLPGEFLISAANGFDVTVDDLFSSFAKYLEEKVLRVDGRRVDMETSQKIDERCFEEHGGNERPRGNDSVEEVQRVEVLGRQWSLQGFTWEEDTEKLRVWTKDGDLE